MDVLAFNVNSIRIGNYSAEPYGEITVSHYEFAFSVGGLIHMSFRVPILDISKCLTHFGVKQKPNSGQFNQLLLTEWDVICLEVSEHYGKLITDNLNSALSSVQSGTSLSPLEDNHNYITSSRYKVLNSYFCIVGPYNTVFILLLYLSKNICHLI